MCGAGDFPCHRGPVTSGQALELTLQPYNTALLSSFVSPTKGQTLIDHELLTAPTKDGSLKRVAAFGWYAGAVGAGEALCLTGLGLLERGVAHPLLVSLLDVYKADSSTFPAPTPSRTLTSTRPRSRRSASRAPRPRRRARDPL